MGPLRRRVAPVHTLVPAAVTAPGPAIGPSLTVRGETDGDGAMPTGVTVARRQAPPPVRVPDAVIGARPLEALRSLVRTAAAEATAPDGEARPAPERVAGAANPRALAVPAFAVTVKAAPNTEKAGDGRRALTGGATEGDVAMGVAGDIRGPVLPVIRGADLAWPDEDPWPTPAAREAGAADYSA